MIPRIIHQTWKSNEIPVRFQAFCRSWADMNPGWTRILWTDATLLDFVATQYPALLETYIGYPQAILRADAARYMLLHHFGGIYADLDTECLASCEGLVGEDRVVLCHEPPAHWAAYAGPRGLSCILFNGVMASPAGHPFWSDVLAHLPVMRHARGVLDATGPLLLTALARAYSRADELVIYNCQLFNDIDNERRPIARYDGLQAATLARHHWAGTWYTKRPPHPIQDGLMKVRHRFRHVLTRGAFLDPAGTRAGVDPAVLAAPASPGSRVTVLVPVRNAIADIEPFLAALARLDHPRLATRLVFCDAWSDDGTFERLTSLTRPLVGLYRDVVLLRHRVGPIAEGRWRAKGDVRRARLAVIAQVRNHLIREGIEAADDWVLWLDVGRWRMPPDILARLMAAGARIVVPHVVAGQGGPSLDASTFATTANPRDHLFYRRLKAGIEQPGPSDSRRLYLHDVRYLDRVTLDGVGGAMMLVDAALHRAGLMFPEMPYRRLVGTEGFGRLAADLGVAPIGLPKLEVMPERGDS